MDEIGDVLTIVLSNNDVARTVERPPDTLFGYDSAGNLVSIEVQNSSNKAEYMRDLDLLMVFLGSGQVVRSENHESGAQLDYDADGNLISVGILDASYYLQDPDEE
jgi:YD repeat-containing protein